MKTLTELLHISPYRFLGRDSLFEVDIILTQFLFSRSFLTHSILDFGLVSPTLLTQRLHFAPLSNDSLVYGNLVISLVPQATSRIQLHIIPHFTSSLCSFPFHSFFVPPINLTTTSGTTSQDVKHFLLFHKCSRLYLQRVGLGMFGG